MTRSKSSIIFGLLLFALTLGWFQIVEGQGPEGSRVLKRETQNTSAREITGPQTSAPQQPNIGFIDSPSITCYQPDPTQDTCYLNWYYMSVNASPNYMITMTLTLNSIGVVEHVQGFFQTSMYVPYNMNGQGFRVACGPLGAGGNPELGNAFSWTLRARDSANLSSANYGTAYCPARKP
ncbi:MAG: hypothetical protein HZB51_14540 [Chloroflexi bacterium]|nr:hypothetical protein [Chloroflexota bacterium]